MEYYGNLAYKDYSPQKTQRPISTHKNTKTVKRNHKQMANKMRNLRRICAILVLAVSAGFMIFQFVAVHETRQQVEDLKVQLAKEEANTSQKVFDLESSVDLSEIEDEAYTRLGMQRPEKYQTIYINVPRDDVTDATAGDVEGFVNSVKAFFAGIGAHIVEMFSIK